MCFFVTVMEKKSNKTIHNPDIRVLLNPNNEVRARIEQVKQSNKCSTPKAIEWLLEQTVKPEPLTDQDVYEFLNPDLTKKNGKK